MKNKELVMAKTHISRKHKHHHRSSQADHYHWTHEIPSKGLIFITLAAFAIMIYGSYIII